VLLYPIIYVVTAAENSRRSSKLNNEKAYLRRVSYQKSLSVRINILSGVDCLLFVRLFDFSKFLNVMAATGKNTTEIEKAKQLSNVPWCEEYEKMISGMLYDSFVPELEASRFKARAWCNKYNNWFPHDDPKADFRHLVEARSEMLKEILGSVGAESFIEPPFTVHLPG